MLIFFHVKLYVKIINCHKNEFINCNTNIGDFTNKNEHIPMKIWLQIRKTIIKQNKQPFIRIILKRFLMPIPDQYTKKDLYVKATLLLRRPILLFFYTNIKSKGHLLYNLNKHGRTYYCTIYINVYGSIIILLNK